MISKYCICGYMFELQPDTGGYTCPRCYRRYDVNGKQIGTEHLIVINEQEATKATCNIHEEEK